MMGALLALLLLTSTVAERAPHPNPLPPGEGEGARAGLDAAAAARFAKLALACIDREYPNKPEHVLDSAADAKPPREFHPAFFGCYDWHSSVHGHWMLVRLLKTFPEMPSQKEIRARLAAHFTAEAMATEARYLDVKSNRSFERTYGWAWTLRLMTELRTWDDSDGKAWRANIEPLAKTLVARLKDFLPKLTSPIRTGVHPNTAFALGEALDYAKAAGDKELADAVAKRARDYYARDRSARSPTSRPARTSSRPAWKRPTSCGVFCRPRSFRHGSAASCPELRRDGRSRSPRRRQRPDGPEARPPRWLEPDASVDAAGDRAGAARSGRATEGPRGVGRETRRGRSRARVVRQLRERALAGVFRRVPGDRRGKVTPVIGIPSPCPRPVILRSAATKDLRFVLARKTEILRFAQDDTGWETATG
jgi:hypothetical protein